MTQPTNCCSALSSYFSCCAQEEEVGQGCDFASLFSRVVSHPHNCCRFILGGAILFTAVVLTTVFAVPVSVVLAGIGAIVLPVVCDALINGIPLIFEAKVLYTRLMYATCFDHTSPIEKSLYLGGIPLSGNRAHLLEELGIQSVLSVTERFEVESGGCLFQTITPQQWGEQGVHHKLVEVEDCTAPTVKNIQDAVEWMEGEARNGRTILVHCQAGVGRSATAVVAYLWKKGGFAEDLNAIIEGVKTSRPQIVISRKNIRILNDWHASLTGGEETT